MKGKVRKERGEGDRDRERAREKERQTDRQTDRQRQHTYIKIDRQRVTEKDP